MLFKEKRMIDFKKLLSSVLLLLMQPAKAWLYVSRKRDKSGMLNSFLYPLMILSGVAVLLGKVFGSGFGVESFFPAAVRTVVVVLTMYLTYHLASYMVLKLTEKFAPNKAQLSHLLTGYSMVVVLVLELCLGLFPNFRIIGWIAQFYTVKIVWDGAAVLMRIPEERRLSFTMIVSVVIIFMPLLLGRIMSLLSVSIV